VSDVTPAVDGPPWASAMVFSPCCAAVRRVAMMCEATRRGAEVVDGCLENTETLKPGDLVRAGPGDEAGLCMYTRLVDL